MTSNLNPDPRCGQCGYIVRGLTTLNCPECGSDLAAVGVVHGPLPSRWRRAGPMILGILIWTGIVVGLYLGALPLVRRYGPIEYYQAVRIKVSASKSRTPNFDLFAHDLVQIRCAKDALQLSDRDLDQNILTHGLPVLTDAAGRSLAASVVVS